MLRSLVFFLIALLAVSNANDASAGWLFGDSIKKAHLDYFDCIKDLQEDSGALGSVLILEGLSEDIPLEIRRNDNLISDEQADILTTIHPSIKKCRKALIKASRKDKGINHVLVTSFNQYDKLYAYFLDQKLSVALTNDFLVKQTDLALRTIGKLKSLN
jgi:hypothetical protein